MRASLLSAVGAVSLTALLGVLVAYSPLTAVALSVASACIVFLLAHEPARNYVRGVGPAIWAAANVVYFSLPAHLNSYVLSALLVALLFLLLEARIWLPALAFTLLVCLCSQLFRHGDPFFSTAWAVTGLFLATSGGALSGNVMRIRGARLMVWAGVAISLVGLVDQYALGSAIYEMLNGTPRVVITYAGTIDRYSGLFAQPNVAGMYFIVPFALAIGLAVGPFRHRGDEIAAVVLAGTIAVTLSRASLIAVFVVALVQILRSGGRRQRARLGGVVVVVAAGLSQLPAVGSFLATLDTPGYQSNEARVLIYHACLEAIPRAPWLGYGFGTVDAELRQYVLPGFAGVPDPLEDAHNLFLGLSLWAGIPFAVVVIGLLVRGAVRQGQQLRPWSLACVGILTDCMLDSPLTSLAHTGLYAVVLAVAVRNPKSRETLSAGDLTRDAVTVGAPGGSGG